MQNAKCKCTLRGKIQKKMPIQIQIPEEQSGNRFDFIKKIRRDSRNGFGVSRQREERDTKREKYQQKMCYTKR